MCSIVRAEEALRAVEEIVVVLVPAEAFAAPKCFLNLRQILHHRGDNLKKSRQINGTIFDCQGKRLLRWKREFLSRGIVSDKTSRRLRRQPFAHIALRQS